MRTLIKHILAATEPKGIEALGNRESAVNQP